MIKIENLKKGDRGLEISTSFAPRDQKYIRNMVVVSIGSKYITCQPYDTKTGEPYGGKVKFNNDDRLQQKDWAQWKLFLGTEKELQQDRDNYQKCMELYRDILTKFNRDLRYEKLSAIKAIIDSE